MDPGVEAFQFAARFFPFSLREFRQPFSAMAELPHDDSGAIAFRSPWICLATGMFSRRFATNRPLGLRFFLRGRQVRTRDPVGMVRSEISDVSVLSHLADIAGLVFSGRLVGILVFIRRRWRGEPRALTGEFRCGLENLVSAGDFDERPLRFADTISKLKDRSRPVFSLRRSSQYLS
jgi:hypothetical protein